MEFENACSEMYYILENMNPSEKNKIPKSIIQFFRDNRSLFYKVNLDVSKNLSEQELKDETKAFIHIINEKYFLDGTIEKIPYKEMKEKIENKEVYKQPGQVVESTALITIKKENKIVSWMKRILKKIGINY